MIFSIASSIPDQIEYLIEERSRLADEAKELREVEEEAARDTGIPCTRENFLAWRSGFLKEMHGTVPHS
jgi:hypothetical protein